MMPDSIHLISLSNFHSNDMQYLESNLQLFIFTRKAIDVSEFLTFVAPLAGACHLCRLPSNKCYSFLHSVGLDVTCGIF